MRTPRPLVSALPLSLGAALLLVSSVAAGPPKKKPKTPAPQVAAAEAAPKSVLETNGSGDLLYTTYFYTAGEAVLHGYEENSRGKIVSLDQGGKTVWEGTLSTGDATLVKTGPGVFGLLAEKKMALLTGTPSSCVALGYYVKNQEGSYRAKRFFTQLPSSVSMDGARVIIWAWDETPVTLTDRTDKKQLFQGTLRAGEHVDLDTKQLSTIGSHILEIAADKSAVSVQVYYDEGFVVPGQDGRAAGQTFYAYVGDITTGENDLLLHAGDVSTKVTVEDLSTKEKLFSGTLKAAELKPLTLSNRYVKVTSDAEIAVSVIAYQHYQGVYAEHHFAMGLEGTGLENNFRTVTSQDLWLFSYFDDSKIKVTEASSGRQIWEGTLAAGNVQSLSPGFGYYQIQSSKGISVLGGASTCGGDYSPAANLFSIDEEILRVYREIQAERQAKGEKGPYTFEDETISGELTKPDGKTAPAPAPSADVQRYQEAVQSKTGRKSRLSPSEIKQRLKDMKVH
jgi:hypothetical protein